MKAYINGTGCISPQETFDNNTFLENIIEYNENHMQVVPPVYKEYVKPLELRRMSRIIRMGLVSALICLKDSGIDKPDSIITGTGMGCVEDTEKFLSAVIDNNEQLLTPTSFIRSTHNTVGAQIANTLDCHDYNFTFVHRGFSFESAVIDALMLIDEGNAKNVLLGGIDENSDNNFVITGRLGYWKKDKISNLDLLNYKTPGSIYGEGSVFFTFGKEAGKNNYCRLDGIHTFSGPVNDDELRSEIDRLLQHTGTSKEEVDVLIMGYSGDRDTDRIYDRASEFVGKEKPRLYFKHLSGEYHTAGAFGLWLGAKVIKTGRIPDVVKVNKAETKDTQKILIYNHYRNEQHSLILLSK